MMNTPTWVELGPNEFGRLLRAPSLPKCVYLRGKREILFHRPCVGIVGSRYPTSKGAKRAYELAKRLAEAGVLVVSGGANGIDLAAHEGALRGGGETLAILGEVFNPKGDERPTRLKRLPGAGLTTITTFGPTIRPNKTLFVVRNQYVAALSDAIVVVEGAEKSGSLHTARYAQRMNVPVFAIPGDPDEPLAAAPNLLLEEGTARALTKIEKLLRVLAIENPLGNKTPDMGELTELGAKIIAMMKNHKQNMALDELCEVMNEDVGKIQQGVFELELAGLIEKKGSELVLR